MRDRTYGPSTAVLVECATCGKAFKRYLAEERKAKGDKRFCSHDCWYAYNVRDNHYLWTGGQHERMNPDGLIWRKAVLERDQYYCRLCHARRHLEAHHILPFGTHSAVRWDVSNGVTLCHECHVQLRNREMEYAKELQVIASIPLEVWHA